MCILNTLPLNYKMKNKMISARMEIDDYANKVLNIIKIKFALKDKSEALNKFIELYGEDVMEKESTEEYAKKVIATAKKHASKYGNQKMTLKELDNLCEV